MKVSPGLIHRITGGISDRRVVISIIHGFKPKDTGPNRLKSTRSIKDPINHGYVEKASEWMWSSFQKFVTAGVYDVDWVGGDEGRIQGYDWE